MGSVGAAGGLSSAAKVGIAAATVVVVVGVGGIVFAATNGFGMLGNSPSSSASSPVETNAGPEDIVPGERPEDAIVGDGPATSMAEIFDQGQWVECRYTVEGYDATTTLKSKTLYRISQQTQGGLSHVIHDGRTTFLWIDGMTQAEKFDNDTYELLQEPAFYPTFDPELWDAAMADDPGTCDGIPAADDALFTLPEGMTTTPGTVR